MISETKGGVSHARNVGMMAATGEWLAFVDADDRLEPNHLQLLMEAAVTDDPDMVIGGFTLYRVKEGTRDVIKLRAVSGEKTKAAIVKLPGTVLNGSWNKIFRASIVLGNKVRYNEQYTTSEDGIFVKELLLKTENLKMIPLTGYKYMCRDEFSAQSRYHACLEQVHAEEEDLTCQLMRQTGSTDAGISAWRRSQLYLNGYWIVCNLFKKGSPLTFAQKRQAIQRVIFDDPEMRREIEAQDRSKHCLFLKIYLFSYRLGSAWGMTVLFQMQYWLKYHMMPLYVKVAPRLRK